MVIMKRAEMTRQRILDCACDLFYRQGYQATTVDQVIDATGISKPTLYKHFPSKEALATAYLKRRKAAELGALRERLAAIHDVRERFAEAAVFVRDALPANNFRGCAFFNMVSEIPDRSDPVVGVVLSFVDEFRAIIRELAEEVKAGEPACSGIDAITVAEDYYVLVCGAIMASQELHRIDPADRAVERVKALLPAQRVA